MRTSEYNLPFYILKIYNRKIQKVRFKEIILDKEMPNTQEEIHYKEIYDSYVYMMNNVNNKIDSSIFIKSYYLLTSRRLSKSNANTLVSIYYQYKDCNTVELLLYLLEQVNKIIRYKKLEYSILIINYFFKKFSEEEIEIYQSMFSSLKQMFKSQKYTINALLVLKRSLSFKEKNKSLSITKECITDFFHLNKSMFMQKFFIKRLFLFGSFAEDTYHDESDLDLIVIFDDSITRNEKIILGKKLEKFIKEKLGIATDVINFEYAITSLDFISLNKMLTMY